MSKLGKTLICIAQRISSRNLNFVVLVVAFALVLQFDFAANSAKAVSGAAHIKMNKVIKKKNKIQMEVTVSNNTNRNISIGTSVNVLQKRVGGRWKKIKKRKDAASTSMAYPIDSGEKRTFVFHLTGYYKRSQLKKGRYRVGIRIVDGRMMYGAFRM